MTNGSDTYRTLFDLYVSGYRATSTSLRSKAENEAIDAILSTFGGLTEKTDKEITRLAGSQDQGEVSAAEDMATILEAGFSNVKDIFAQAVDWDAMHVKAVSVASQPSVATTVNAQEATDQELVANLANLVAKAKEALVRAAAADEPTPEPQADPAKADDAVVEPTPEPQADPEEADDAVVEPTSEPQADPEEADDAVVEPTSEPQADPEEADDAVVEPTAEPQADPEEADDATAETALEEARRTGEMNQQLVIENEELSGAAAPADEIPETADPEDPSKDDDD